MCKRCFLTISFFFNVKSFFQNLFLKCKIFFFSNLSNSHSAHTHSFPLWEVLNSAKSSKINIIHKLYLGEIVPSNSLSKIKYFLKTMTLLVKNILCLSVVLSFWFFLLERCIVSCVQTYIEWKLEGGFQKWWVALQSSWMRAKVGIEARHNSFRTSELLSVSTLASLFTCSFASWRLPQHPEI